MAPTAATAAVNYPVKGKPITMQCPFAAGLQGRSISHDDDTSRAHMQEHDIVDGPDDWMTSDVGGRFTEQRSLRAGRRGPTLKEDFAFRQKMTHFDHERVSERQPSRPIKTGKQKEKVG